MNQELEKVRGALERFARTAETKDMEDEAYAALIALADYETQIKGLLEIGMKFTTGAVGHDDFDRLTAAMAKVKP